MKPLFHIPKINLETLSDKEIELYYNLNSQSYGRDIAMGVTDKLSSGKALYHAHRDYCGLGLFFYENLYTLGTTNDGYDAPDQIIATCPTSNDFVNWLSKENDQSMSLYGEKFNNQTITLLRLQWFLEEDYSPVWNDFCSYIRRRNAI